MGEVVSNRPTLLNKCLQECKIPLTWYNSETISLFKKGDITNIDNYRPISLLSHLYKPLMRILTNCLTNKFDYYQTVEQIGFRSGYSTINHRQTLRIIIDVPLYLDFIDFYGAFDSIYTSCILREALNNPRINSRYTNIIINIYENVTMHTTEIM